MNSVEYGPLVEAGSISAGLDYYKPTMSQLDYEQHPDVEVTFTFKNRGQQRIEDYVSVNALQERLDIIRERGWQEEEIDYFASLLSSDGDRVFSDDTLGYLKSNQLPPVNVWHDEDKDDLAIDGSGPSALVTFWETIIMSEVNEMYFENYVTTHGLNLMEIYDEGERRLSEKIDILRANPDIKIADFGTRRHFSLRWQRHVLERLQTECPENFIGTSNVALARTLKAKPIGTFAHEMPMVWAGIADAKGEDIRSSHRKFLELWYEKYGVDLSTALTDTFGTDFFFDNFTDEQAENWRGLRHDSGDPIEFGERAIAFYEDKGIDPLSKTIVFSDGLDIDKIVELHQRFNDRVGLVFGWGTTLTNDLGLRPLNVVAKATHVRLLDGSEADTVKLSDDPGKHTGSEQKVEEYQHVFGKFALTH